MTFELTSERLQDIAVKCVSEFITKQASLSESIAKEAQELELNSEQIKRAIEATNTIAYLRQLEKSADRTFEFDVADYNVVMGKMCLPDDMTKSAGMPPWLKGKDDEKDDGSGDDGKSDDKDSKDDRGSASKEKGSDEKEGKKEKAKEKEGDKDSDDESDSDGDGDKDDESSKEDKQEKRAMLNKAFFQAKNKLEKMAYDEQMLYMELDSAISLVKGDRHSIEKLAFVIAPKDLPNTIKLCGLTKRAEEDLVFTDKELADTKALYSLYKKAQEFVKTKAETEDFIKRAEAVLFHKTANVEKLAGVIKNNVNKGIDVAQDAVAAPLGGISRGVGYGAGKALTGTGKIVGNVAAGAGKGIGNAVSNMISGKKPSFAGRVVGATGFGALNAASMSHENNIRDIDKE